MVFLGLSSLALVLMIVAMATPGWWVEELSAAAYSTIYRLYINPFYFVSEECIKTINGTICKKLETEYTKGKRFRTMMFNVYTELKMNAQLNLVLTPNTLYFKYLIWL